MPLVATPALPPAVEAPWPDAAPRLSDAYAEDTAAGAVDDADPNDFLVGDVDVKARLGLNGFSAGPLSLLGSLVGWTELGLVVDVGVMTLDDLTFGIGAEAHYGRALAIELITRLLSSADLGASWRATDAGLAARFTMHYSGLRTLDAYGVGLLGPTASAIKASATVDGTTVEGDWRSAGLRFGGGAGVSTTTSSGLLGGVELRYLVGHRFRRDQHITLTDPDGNEETLMEMSGFMKPPRGFSWVFFVGGRI